MTKHRSERLLEALENAGIEITLCKKDKAVKIIRKHLCDTHKDAVERTFMATNKKQYQEPNFED
jgi:hypothetical protein